MSAVPGSVSADRRTIAPITRTARNSRVPRPDVPPVAVLDESDGSGWTSIDRLSYTRQTTAPVDRQPARMPRNPVDPYALVILIPAYNDWIAVSLLLGELDRALVGKGLRARVLLVDDGSTEPA